MPQPRRTDRCETCKQRKIRCDQKRPACGPCIKGRRRCVVLKKELTFLYWMTNSAASHLYTESRQESGEHYHEQALACAYTPLCDDGLARSLETLGLTQLWEDFLTLQLSNRTKSGSISTSGPFEGANPPLWQSLAHIYANSPSLRYAFAAVASARIGWVESNESLCSASDRYYSASLLNLRGALDDTVQSASVEVIATIMTLAAYELYQDSTSGFGYISHAQGASKLIESLGPHYFTSGVSHELFLNFRELEIVHALLGHKPTFLASIEWSTIPWAIQPKSAFDKLIDRGALLLKLIERTDELEVSHGEGMNNLRFDLINGYWKAWESFSKWYEGLVVTNAPTPYSACEDETILKGSIPQSTFRRLFSSSLQFPDMEMARCMLFFWGFMCIVCVRLNWEHRALRGEGTDYRTCRACCWSVGKPCRCDYIPPGPIVDDTGMRPPPSIGCVYEFADNISRSINYLFKPETKGLGAEIAVFPLRISDEIYRFRNDTAKRAWTLEVFKELEDWGVSWSTSLWKMQVPQYKDLILRWSQAG